MLYLYTGTDREKTRAAVNKVVAREGKNKQIVRITDASALPDLQEALRGSGMFGARVVVLDGVFANDEMKAIVLDALSYMKALDDRVFILEEKLDAQTRRTLEKHAAKAEHFDISKRRERGGEIFALAYALKGGDKKRLWVEYQRALSRDEAPEAIHGVLFWGAKNMLLSAKKDPERSRGARLVAELAELPHEARRYGFELEYALEHYILGLPRRAP